ncbi:hypothetical protein O6H91_08G055800 [Diphasiastrum complanatum]|nr:hypothetical protein O6H91_08G055800 [Diphasiastrum complanatum]KAJ7546818.1 hypothetical protein O6H91_08G055800 [Diphasiastrum complanatum]
MEIPGIILHSEFVSPAEEKELLAAVDERPWQTLAKRKVQHYGYEFLYKVRNVDLTKKLGELPTFVDHVVERMSALPEVANSTEKSLPFDQLTVNEYPRGVGLSPHIDTHSAFEGSILSLSLAGACVMEFRKYHKHSYDLHTSKANYDSRVHGTHIMGRGLDCEARQTIPDLHQTTYFSEQEMIEPPKVKVERRVLYLPQRSLLILSNEARYGWHHYIPHHKEDVVNGEKVPRSSRRVSFTFRKVRLGPCYCQFPHLCDSQAEIAEVPVSIINAWGSKDNDSTVLGREYTICSAVEDNAVHDKIHGVSLTVSEVKDATTCKVWIPATPEIEKMYVQEVYDAIAPHFSSTRFAKWPKVAQFLHSIAPGSIVVDAGCGNGKYLGLNPKCFFVGCDISAPLVAICAQRGHEVLIADALFLPYRTGVCDAAISIAVLHHLSSEQRRVRAIEELLRVVRHGGKVLITVWAVEQEDKSLLTKWTPLTGKYMEEWVGSSSHKAKGNLSENSLHMIQEGDTLEDKSADEEQEFVTIFSQKFDGQEDSRQMKEQQEYFVPWHLPYHRAEIGGASAAAVARGFARKDDKKGAVVYNRYYHVFVEGELERLISKCAGASVVDQFYDKSNWCVVIEKSCY